MLTITIQNMALLRMLISLSIKAGLPPSKKHGSPMYHFLSFNAPFFQAFNNTGGVIRVEGVAVLVL